MIKLSFSNFSFTSDGNTSKGSVKAAIKLFDGNKWYAIANKEFATKIIRHKDDKSDINKAYKYIQAKLEKEAYNWALNNTTYQISLAKRDLKIFTDFADKAKHIVNHDNEYLSKF